MKLMKRKEDFWLPSSFDDFFRPSWFREVMQQRPEGFSIPATNIKETNEAFLVELAAPGKKKDDFAIEVEDNVLTISSEGKQEHGEKDKEGRYTRREFSYAAFQRAFTLPETVHAEKIKAAYENGVLTVTLPKRDVIPTPPKKTIAIG